MNAINAIKFCAAVLALTACTHSRSILDQDTPDTGTLTPRTQVDLSQLTPEQRDSLVAQRARDSAQLDGIGFLKREATFTDAYFIEPDEIAALQPKVIADIFRHVPVLTERPGPRSTRLPAGQGCFLTYVNGSMLRARLPNELDTFIRARDILAAEVYPPGESPPHPFARPSTLSECTTVALWTRSRPN